MAIDEIASKLNIKLNKNKFEAVIGEGFENKEKIMLAKPQTYMNLSGESIIKILDFYKIPLTDLIVIYDDIDLPFGGLRIKPSGSAGTHNGMRNITELVKSKEFTRVRMGTGRPPENIDLKDYVLMKLTDEEKAVAKKLSIRVADAVLEIVNSGVNKAMNLYNKIGE